jgi:hypothetical protein
MHQTLHTIPRARAIQFLTHETDGRIFSAHFQKTDGSMRAMVCRRGVKRHLAGGTLSYDAEGRGHVPVWDMSARQYRMVNGQTLVSFRIGGETFLVSD